MLFFQFPEDARWDAAREAVEFSVVLGPYASRGAAVYGLTSTTSNA
jgi:hypothetical protein